jgi:hypothetical protein
VVTVYGSYHLILKVYANISHLAIVKDDVLYIDSGLQKWNGSDIGFGAFGLSKCEFFAVSSPMRNILPYTFGPHKHLASEAQ